MRARPYATRAQDAHTSGAGAAKGSEAARLARASATHIRTVRGSPQWQPPALLCMRSDSVAH